jgi:hypothetical protein
MIHSCGMKATLVAGIVSLMSTTLLVQSFPLMPAVNVASQGQHHRQCRTSTSSSYRSMTTEPDHDHASSSSSSSEATPTVGRRSFLWQTTAAAALLSGFPGSASAGIDVSGLAGGSNGSDKNLIREQLRAYDGSGAGRVQQLKEASSSKATTSKTMTPSPGTSSIKVPDTVATTATRYTLNGARTSSAGLLTTRYQDNLAASGVGAKAVPVEFEYPSDWLQLDRALGGIQYVDQRNGDKLYIFRVSLPRMPNSSTTDANAPLLSLETVPNQFFGQAIFDPRGSFVKGGNDVGEYKVVSSKVTAKQSESVTPRRRLRIKYSTVTGNGYTVERRALVDAYEVGTEVFMLMTSSNAVKFEAKGRERDTVEAIVDSFRIGDA